MKNAILVIWTVASLVLVAWVVDTAIAEAHVTKCQPQACEPTNIEAARVWTVRVDLAGRRGRVQVNAEDLISAAQAGIALSGGTVTDVWADTYTLGQVRWDDQ